MKTHVLRIVLLAAICLLVVACGSSNTPTVAAANVSAPVPTAVPTTAPLSLPAVDVTLPALAPLPAAVSVAAPEPTTMAVEPAAEPTAVSALAITSVDQWSDCVLAAAQATDAVALLDPIAASTPTDMTSVQLNSLAASAVNCDLVATSLGATDLGDHVATAETCLNAWLESSGGGSVLVGLTSIGWGQATPAWAHPHLVDALDSCFTGASFAADVMAVVAANASLNGAFDNACLAASFDASGTLRNFAQTLANDPDGATLYVSLGDTWVLNCANVGHMVAAAAVADGVALSASTITCIDVELKRTGAIAQLVAGTADTDAVGIATITCLTDAEAAALLG